MFRSLNSVAYCSPVHWLLGDPRFVSCWCARWVAPHDGVALSTGPGALFSFIDIAVIGNLRLNTYTTPG